MRSLIIILLSLLLSGGVSYAGPISNEFFPAPAQTLSNTAGTTATYVQFTNAQALAAADVIIKNGGSNPIYCDLGTGGAAFVTTVPTNTTGGGALIVASTSILFNKRANDTVSCITSTGSSLFTVTPGTGNQ